ncbi:hypothetical protein H3009_gp08 [Bacillus phage Harambe]|uniref:Uncharacterized protein n=1 Tax=Bacillus phage Harambe TaxID=1981931 RepID=A0A1W6JSD3_9CAUD|nr:hypothetical protein H3009_gp08 [Bacillus phage Harambe]ARM70157.1 hypothetical protein HARAMBE_8 [Bacillus phage Harambe]
MREDVSRAISNIVNCIDRLKAHPTHDKAETTLYNIELTEEEGNSIHWIFNRVQDVDFKWLNRTSYRVELSNKEMRLF